MASLLKSIAIAASAGIAVGFCATAAASTRRTPQRQPEGTADDVLRIEPLLDRLERIETQPQPHAAELSRRVEAQAVELEALRAKVGETERRTATAVEALENRLRQMKQDIPSLVESNVATRLSELELRIESQVEAKVSERIGALERTIMEQSASIGALRDRAHETDADLKRLIAAVERLCERVPQPSATVLPFEAHLAEAAQREPAVEPRVRVIKENDPEAARARFPLARIFAFVLAIVLPGLAR